MSMCPACTIGLSKYECERPDGKRCKPDKEELPARVVTSTETALVDSRPPDLHEEAPKPRTGPVKVNEDVTDAKSTGRKRAAVAYPIIAGMTCEWSGLKFAGGGEFPIIGCIAQPAKHRHHGPDKDTLHNDEGNVHRICHKCHNRWHARNDSTYEAYRAQCTDGDGIFRPRSHDAETRATAEELYQNEQHWEARR